MKTEDAEKEKKENERTNNGFDIKERTKKGRR